MLRVQNLSVHIRGKPLFQSLTFELKSSELLQVIGQNGSGKSTLLRILSGLRSREGSIGEVLWSKQNNETPGSGTQCCYLGHKLGIRPHFTVEEHLEWFCAFHAASLDEHEKTQRLEQFRLAALKSCFTTQLSRGQSQRLALCQVSLSKKPVWLLDEPLTALDEQGVCETQAVLTAHLKEGGSVILTAHRKMPLGTSTFLTLASPHQDDAQPMEASFLEV